MTEGAEKEQEGAAPERGRDPDLTARIREVEKAAADWGVHADALEGRFVAALLTAIAATGRTNLAVLADLEGLLEKAREVGDGERKRLETVIEAGELAVEMARRAAQLAVVAGDKAEKEFDSSVSRIAQDLSVKLLAQSQHWLVLRQTARNRRDAWRLAFGVAAAAVGLFVGGYWAAGRLSGEEAAQRAVFAAVQKCSVKPLFVQGAKGEFATCRLDDIVPKEGRGS